MHSKPRGQGRRPFYWVRLFFLSLLVSYSLYPLDSIFLIIFDYFQPLCYTHTATTPDTGTERG